MNSREEVELFAAKLDVGKKPMNRFTNEQLLEQLEDLVKLIRASHQLRLHMHMQFYFGALSATQAEVTSRYISGALR